MSEELLIYPERISAKPLVFEGTADPGEFPDLAESLASDEGELRFRVTARLEGERRKVLSCIIEGFVFLTCQSSLEAFRHEISISDVLVLVDSESELPPIQEESDAEDYIVADGPIDVLDLVEEAVLLALPMVPRKPGLKEGGEAAKAAAVPKPSPFAALAGLKKKPD